MSSRSALAMLRAALVFSLLLAGCEGLRPLPTLASDGSLHGTQVSFTDSTPRDQDLTDSFRQGFTADLRVLGADLVEQGGQLAVVTVGLTLTDLRAEIRASGKLVASVSYKRDVTCGSINFSTNTTEIGAGFARALANEVARVAKDRPELAQVARPAPVDAPPPRPSPGLRLAVLELRNFTKELTRENAQYFTDLVRTAALKAQPKLEVITRENLVVLLKASGKALDDCEGECEVDTGRRIGADEIVSGEIQKLGSFYKLSLRLHDTHEGRLLASTQASGKTVDELDQSAQKAAEELLH